MTDSIEELRARISVLEALVLMTVTEPYVDAARKRPDFDAVRAIDRDARRWLATLQNHPKAERDATRAQAVRLLSELPRYVAVRLAG